MKSPAELTETFRSAGRKVTPQRQAVFRALYESGAHPSAEAVYAVVSAEMPTVSLRTVYQTLNDLTAMGEINALELGTGAARFDPTPEPHHHLVCTGCGWIGDIPADLTDVTVPSGVTSGFEVAATEIVFRGRCATCAAAGEVEAGT
jgi:Fe2+ or Zn2+ uptake regulation protein